MTATEPISSFRVNYSPDVLAAPELDRAAKAGTAILRDMLDGSEPEVPWAGGLVTAHWRAGGPPEEPLGLILTQGATTLQSRFPPADMLSGWGALHLGLLLHQLLNVETGRALARLRTTPLAPEAE
jgi:hypothetical protein